MTYVPDLSWPSIFDVLDHYGAMPPMERHGWQPIRCAFHDDRNASAAVNYELNIYYCHGCGISTTGLGLIMREERMTQDEARLYASQHFAGGDTHVRGEHQPRRGLPGKQGNPTRSGRGIQPRVRRRTVLD